MAVEAKRGCGYRKVGGLYMVSGQLSAPCGRLPLELHVCPTCMSGVKQTRAWTWVNPAALFSTAECYVDAARTHLQHPGSRCAQCPAGNPALMGEQAGLLWVGGSFYPEAEDFMREARQLGVSRRIPAVPRNFKLGESWVLIAHPRAIYRAPVTDAEREEFQAERDNGSPELHLIRKGVITMFRPTAVEKIVTESQAADEAEMAKLTEKGITPVVVPDDDKDHQGSVHDKDDQS